MKRLLAFLLCLGLALPAAAQNADAPIQQVLQTHSDLIAKVSRRTIQTAIDGLTASGLPAAQNVMQRWQNKEMWQDEETGLFVFAEEIDRDTIRIFDVADGTDLGEVSDDTYKQLKPNSGVRGLIAAGLVRFQLTDTDPTVRSTALDAIARDPDETHLPSLRDVQAAETDPDLIAQMTRLERLLTIEFGADDAEKIEAISYFDGDLGVDARAALNPLVTTRIEAAKLVPSGPEVVRTVTPGDESLSKTDAYSLLVRADLAPPLIPPGEVREALIRNIDGDMVAGCLLYTSPSPRDRG